MSILNCIVVEDRITDKEYIEALINNNRHLSLKASFENALEASDYIKMYPPHVIFLDIDLPLINGVDFLKQLRADVLCVFVTAHSEFAWQGYESQAFDFILKPVKVDRLEDCVRRLLEYNELQRRSDIYETQINRQTIFIKEGFARHQIKVDDILYIEALKDYSKVVTVNCRIMTLSNIKQFIEQLPPGVVKRIHRSYAVAVNKISKITSTEVFLEGSTRLPIGKTYRQDLKK